MVSKYARHWGFEVMECDPPRKEREGGNFHTIEELAKECDIVTFHTPLDKTTHHLLNRRLLSAMPAHAVIINASRGGVVENSAVVNSSHRYYFDVWEHEPKIDGRLLKKAVVATPHIAGYSVQGKANATALAVRALAAFFNLPLEDWYPEGVACSNPQEIDWQTLVATIDDYCDLDAESAPLKAGGDFEALRNNYKLRNEYF
jgi:erythronate-4-phosphate dehydrogenase